MKKIGITGNIASGKTTVENIISSKGYKVIDADKICHEGIENNLEIQNQIKNVFYDFDVLNSSATISREKLGKIVFENLEYKVKLENILHPFAKRKIVGFFNKNQKEKFVFASIPLLYETNLQEMFDKVILVYTNDDIRLERLLKRNNYTKEQATSRMKAQMPQDDKTKLADYIIYNNNDLILLEQETLKILDFLK